MYRASARLVREIAGRYGIPLDRNHILGHGEVSRLSGYCTNHTDPGSGWDWGRFMAYVREGGAPPAPGPATGVLRGVVYDAAGSLHDPRNRIAGATVRLSNGMTATTGPSGAFAFRVTPGSYAVTASRDGYQSASLRRTVTAGTDVWGSVGLRRGGAWGEYVGVVYDRGRPLSDPANRVAGATVRLSNGMTVTTAANGYFRFRVPVGRYTATASKSGWQGGSTTRDVTADREVWGSIGMGR
jgi:hypothetical protein